MKVFSRCSFVLLCFSTFFLACNNSPDIDYAGWPVFNGNETANKYSSLTQIDTSNVQQLQVAWEYHAGGFDTAAHSQIQCNPIVVNGVLYATTPQSKLFAVDAATGKQLWMFSPFDSANGQKIHFNLNNTRGVAFWSDGKDDQRIFYSAGSFLNAVNAKTGRLVESFGNGGKIDLHYGLGEQFKDLFITSTSPPAIYKDLVITGTRVSEGMDAAPGHVRAFDARTGSMKWIFHTIPQPGELGYDTWEDPDAWKFTGGANNWMGMTIDQEAGIAYMPLGSASMDFYGGKRKGANLFANSLVAVDAATGKYIWHYQFIHHDTWDRDPPAAPVLLTVKKGNS
ncbi:MAG TPA: PQQ-binding-like beta-propeller repeat protein, partial [Chitinophagaceae bacterium]|nr:PQQ-binding-like beta-propeller repeat protein [Chitinophagaceae bacterium]